MFALITIYLCGYATAYLLLRYILRIKQQMRWTLQHRIVCLLVSLLSWAIVLWYYGLKLWAKFFPKTNLDKEVKF